ncbi:MAG: hypothetical protein H6838_06720 [Planctomycetes bacterium]|nr:hypothetical protein [Planctomycetota bacterium]MCB9885168.1 hypothetical protein [Planctomycetota bacterium]
MRSLLLVFTSLCVVSLLALGASFVWWRGDAPPPLLPQEDPVTADASLDGEAEVATIATADAADGERDAAIADDQADGEQREAVDELDPEVGPRVQVVRGQPPLPVAEATVYFISEAEARRRLPDAEQIPQAAWPERVGQRLVTDATGAVTLPPTRAPWLVSAALGDEFAFGQARSTRRPTTLALQTDERVAVVVTWPDGAPAPGVPVTFAHQWKDQRSEQLFRTTTDARGRALLPHFQILRPPPRNKQVETFAALLRLPAATPVGAPFEGRPAPKEAIALVAPWLGKVEVQLADQRGTPLLSPAQVWLVPDPPQAQDTLSKPEGPPLPVPRFETALREDKPASGAPVVFANVPVQTPVRISARFPYAGRMPSLSATGPEHVGESRRVELRLPDDRAVLAGRCRLDDGEPIATQKVSLILWREGSALGELFVETIDDGRFDLVAQARGGTTQDQAEFRWTRRDADRSVVYGVRVPIAPLVQGERRELGDLVFTPLPPLANGMVVDDLGAPVEGATVQLQAQRLEDGKESWRTVPGWTARTGEDGRFALFGDSPFGNLRLFADTGQHFGAATPLPPPGRPVRITIDRNGVLVGRVLLPGWVGDGMCELTVQPADPSLDERTRRRQAQRVQLGRARGGRFVVQPLRAGNYDVAVRMRNLPDPMLELSGIYVSPGTNRDGRLALIDLRQSIFRYRLQAVDGAGQRMNVNTPLLTRFLRADGSPGSAGFRFQRGRAEVVTAQSLLEFVAFAPGCPPTVVTLPPGDHSIMLQQQLPAVLTLPGARQLCGPQRLVRVSTILTGATGFPESLSGLDQRSGERFAFPRWELGKSSGAWLEGSDTVQVPLALSGEYEVVLRVHATDSPRSPQASVPLGNHMLRVGGADTVRIPLDAEKVLAAIQQVDEQQRAAIERARQQTEQRAQRGPQNTGRQNGPTNPGPPRRGR